MENRADTRLEHDLLFAIVKERYGHLLNDDQLEEVRKSVMALQAFSDKLRSVRLTNDIEPFSTFKPYRGGDDA